MQHGDTVDIKYIDTTCKMMLSFFTVNISQNEGKRMAKKSGETFKKLDTQIAELQAKKNSLLRKEKLKEEKERDKLLIKYGEIIKNYLPNCKSPEDLEAHFKHYIFLTSLASPTIEAPLIPLKPSGGSGALAEMVLQSDDHYTIEDSLRGIDEYKKQKRNKQ